MPGAIAAHFLDTSGNWAETYVNILSDKGVIPAASDGKFQPNDPVTRAVFASWMVKVMGLQDQPVPQTPSYADVKTTDWYYRDVEIIRQNNFISGYADGFRPNQFIQKGEVISILARALNKPAPDETQIEDELAKYKDASKVPSWARTGIAEASLAGIMLTGPDSLSIGADKLASRADTAALLYKLDEYLARRDESDALKRTARQNTGVPNSGWNPSANQSMQGGNQFAQAPNQFVPPTNQNLPPANSLMPPPAGQNYQGQVAKGDYFGAQSQYSGPPPQYGAAASPQFGQAQGGPPGTAGNALQGGVIVLAAGTKFKAQLKNSIDSASTQAGEEIRAVINEPVYANGTEVIPAGSRLIGTCSSVTPAHRFKAGANGKMEIKFTSCETPDGRTIPLSASVDENEQRMSGGTTAGRIGKGLVTTGVGAAGGAALGTALGAIVGGTAHGNVGASTGMGAVFGTALGAGVGGVGAIVRKGSELKITAGNSIPVKLDEQMPIQLPQPGAIRAQYPVQQPRNY